MTVPGTYSSDNYGKYIQDFIAFDYQGKVLQVDKTNENTWVVADGKKLDRISYWVNDTYDTESEVSDAVFSPAGTNILEGRILYSIFTVLLVILMDSRKCPILF